MNYKPVIATCMMCIAHVFFSARQSVAQSIFAGNICYETPSLIVPVGIYSTAPSMGEDWMFSISGWTGAAQWEQAMDPEFTVISNLDITPINSNSCNILYQNGVRDNTLNFTDATIEFRTGISIQSTDAWNTNIGVIGLYEDVAELPESILEYWKSPYAGVDITTAYTDVRSDDPIITRFDGVKLSADAQGLADFSGRAWWRTSATCDAGRKLGPLFLHGGASAFLGNSLNIVNQFLIGGCWDILGSTELDGYHYAEFRLDRAVVVQAAADVHLAGTTELGVGGGYLWSDNVPTFGGTFKVMTTISGVTFEGGVGLPKATLVNGDFGNIVGFGSIAFGLFP
jgi:hypothetical protein